MKEVTTVAKILSMQTKVQKQRKSECFSLTTT